MTIIIERSVASGDLQEVYLLVFTENVVFESMLYKGNLQNRFVVWDCVQVTLSPDEREMFQNIVHITGTQIVEVVIN